MESDSSPWPEGTLCVLTYWQGDKGVNPYKVGDIVTVSAYEGQTTTQLPSGLAHFINGEKGEATVHGSVIYYYAWPVAWMRPFKRPEGDEIEDNKRIEELI